MQPTASPHLRPSDMVVEELTIRACDFQVWRSNTSSNESNCRSFGADKHFVWGRSLEDALLNAQIVIVWRSAAVAQIPDHPTGTTTASGRAGHETSKAHCTTETLLELDIQYPTFEPRRGRQL